jgi:hypothetical protein
MRSVEGNDQEILKEKNPKLRSFYRTVLRRSGWKEGELTSEL